jgi:predicted NAD/FAD-binding protein
VLACHSDQSLALLADASPAEREVLGAIRYHANRAVLHTDTSVLPQRRLAWAAWNYERAAEGSRKQAAVCLHYLINRLQPLPFETPVVVSLNPLSAPRSETVLGTFDYAHPVFDAAAIAAQKGVPDLQGVAHTWFCGAWTRYGFHEDGLSSGLVVLERLRSSWATRDTSAAREAA